METIRRHSRKRDAIRRVLAGTKEHPSAEMVYEQLHPEFPDLSLGTVYRNLALFRDEGEIITVATVDGEERFDYNTAPHAHFVCRNCHRVLDLDQLLPRKLLSEVQVPGEAQECSVLFYGICNPCLQGSE